MAKSKTAIKKCGLFNIHPNIGHDTLNGERITNGLLHMGFDFGTATINHGGKDYKINIIGGGTISLSVVGGRSCSVDLKELVKQAVDAGLLEDKMDFTEAE